MIAPVTIAALALLGSLPMAVVTEQVGSGDQGAAVSVSALVSDGADPTTVQLIDPATGQASAGPLTIAGEGTWTVAPDTGMITFTPDAQFQGDPTPINYTATDADGETAVPAPVTIAYPDVTDASGAGPAGTVIRVSPQWGGDMDFETLRLIDPTTNTPTSSAVVIAGQGTWTPDPATGTVLFEADAALVGNPDPIRYTGLDAQGNLALPAAVTVTITAVEPSPPAPEPTSAQPPEPTQPSQPTQPPESTGAPTTTAGPELAATGPIDLGFATSLTALLLAAGTYLTISTQRRR